MKIIKYAASLLALSLALCAGTASAQQFKMLSSWDSSYAYNPYIIDPFVKGIEQATNGRIKIDVFGPETVPPFEQLQPVGSGVFQFLFTHGAYHLGTTSLMTLADALHGSLEDFRKSGVYDYLDKHYQKFGLKLVMLPITPDGAYHIIARSPVTDKGDLSGMKIRGTLTYKGVVDYLNGSLTVIPASEVYTALEKGVVDGAAWPSIGVLDYRWYEVAKYLIRPKFGTNFEPLFMNLDAWNKLSQADKDAMSSLARKIEDQWYGEVTKLWDKEEQQLIAKGMIRSEIGEKQKAGLLDAWAKGLWALGEQQKPAEAKAFHEFAVSKGLTK